MKRRRWSSICGIVGYNCDKEHVNLETFDEKRQFEALRQAWSYNEHRGRSSVGYFRVDIENDQVYAQKAGHPAQEILAALEEDNKTILPPSYVFGAHTRAATKGDPKDNKNNHPVYWDDVYVTHNGVIHNDEQIKAQYVQGVRRDEVPEVDTAAISILLSLCQPYNYDEIIEALSELRGGYAFHAIWEHAPGLSLLVKGSQYPLIVRYDDRGLFSYASEDDSQWHMLAAMGVDPNVASMKIRDMDDFSAIWVFNGEPIEWRRFRRTQQWVGTAKSPFERSRLLPPLSKKDDPIEVYSTDVLGDYAFVKHHSIHSVPKDSPDLKLLYLTGQFAEDNAVQTFPLLSNMGIWAKLCEADEVYTITSQDTLHALYGEIELVLKKTDGKLLDVFDHSKFDQQERWMDSDEEEPVAAVEEVRIEWDRWLIANSTHPRPVCVSFQPSEWSKIVERHLQQEAAKKKKEAEEAARKEKNKQKRGKGSLPVPFQGRNGEMVADTNPSSMQGSEDTIPKGVKELPINRSVNMENFDKILVQHPTESVWYFKDLKCQNHKGALFSEHESPLECANILTAYIAAMSCVTDLAVFCEFDPIGFKFAYNIKETCIGGGDHAWEIFFKKRIWLTDTFYLSIPRAEKCLKCDSRFSVREYPEAITRFALKEDKSLAAV